MEREFAEYPSPFLIPISRRPRYLMLAAANRFWLERAATLGWEPDE